MDKKDIISFFDRCAPWWDADMIRNEELIAAILNNGGIRAGVHVLDVACGTGVLFPYYLQRGVASVTGIDISPEMAKIAEAYYRISKSHDFISELRQIRKQRNLNQQKVALDLHISRESLSYYENGKREPSLALLVAMSEYFNVSINYLITGQEFEKR